MNNVDWLIFSTDKNILEPEKSVRRANIELIRILLTLSQEQLSYTKIKKLSTEKTNLKIKNQVGATLKYNLPTIQIANYTRILLEKLLSKYQSNLLEHEIPTLNKNLTQKQLEILIQISTPLNLNKGDIVYKEGSCISTLYQVKSGQLNIISHSKPLGLLKEGDFFGESSLFVEEPSLTTVIALDQVSLLSIPIEKLQLLYIKYPRYSAKLYRSLIDTLALRLQRTIPDQ